MENKLCSSAQCRVVHAASCYDRDRYHCLPNLFIQFLSQSVSGGLQNSTKGPQKTYCRCTYRGMHVQCSIFDVGVTADKISLAERKSARSKMMGLCPLHHSAYTRRLPSDKSSQPGTKAFRRWSCISARHYSACEPIAPHEPSHVQSEFLKGTEAEYLEGIDVHVLTTRAPSHVC